MPRGDKSSYSDKQKRKAEHIEEGYEKRGVSAKTAKARAWATVNKESGGGKKSGSGRGKKESHASSRKGGRLSHSGSKSSRSSSSKRSSSRSHATSGSSR
jgi:plasmid stabilization system protein ParE